MQSRYINNSIKKTTDGRTVFQSKIYPNIPPSDEDIFVATETGDRFDTLAYQYYNDSTLWWIIACANNIHNATQVRPPRTFFPILIAFKILI
jgi:hypothetical protein